MGAWNALRTQRISTRRAAVLTGIYRLTASRRKATTPSRVSAVPVNQAQLR